MDGDRVVIGRKSDSSMVKVRWSEDAPQGLCDLETAEELGAKWEGDELVVYDLPGRPAAIGVLRGRQQRLHDRQRLTM